MIDINKFYINGEWVLARSDKKLSLVDPSTAKNIGQVAIATDDEVSSAVKSAEEAFRDFSLWTVQQRIELLERILEQLEARSDEIGEAISLEMGAPLSLGKGAQAGSGPQHFAQIIEILKTYEFETNIGTTKVKREPIGVCALITPWNWPLNQIATKVAPAIAAGCTMVLKPSENAPLSANILTEIFHDCGVPPGVFNLVHGDGVSTGAALCKHPLIDMISFTGSTNAGVAIGQLAAKDIKKVALELGGKSPCIILEGADLENTVENAVRAVMLNSGQSCNASAKFIVERPIYNEVCAIAARVSTSLNVGPAHQDKDLGPVANKKQYDFVVRSINHAVTQGATLLSGGAELPEPRTEGFFIKPTILSNVDNSMSIFHEEIFGPVVTITIAEDVDHAVELSNDTEFGLSGAVWASSIEAASQVADRLRTGMVHLNGAGLDTAAPFGGYRKSGIGREWGVFGLEEFLETKSVYGALARSDA